MRMTARLMMLGLVALAVAAILSIVKAGSAPGNSIHLPPSQLLSELNPFGPRGWDGVLDLTRGRSGQFSFKCVIAIPERLLVHRPSANACLANLKQIEGATATWAMEKHKPHGEIPRDEDLFGPNAYLRVKPQCPGGGVYTLAPEGEAPRCSIPQHVVPPNPWWDRL